MSQVRNTDDGSRVTDDVYMKSNLLEYKDSHVYLYSYAKRVFMDNGFSQLAELLNLTPYQAAALSAGADKYDFSRLEKRDGNLYAPYAERGLYPYIVKLIRGRRTDVIGRDGILARGQRR